MRSPALSPLDRQIARVGRRLFYQTLANQLVGCWTAALILTAGWFFLQPLVLPALAGEARWAISGGLVGLASVLSLILALRRAPSRVAAALALDERFGLKERVTTALTLPPDQAATPAAEALLADVNRRVGPLEIGSRFPLRLSWTALLVPAGAVLTLLALLLAPTPGPAAGEGKSKERPALAEAAQEKPKVASPKKKPDPPGRQDQPGRDEEKDLDAEVARLIEQPPDPEDQDQLVEHLQDMNDKEEKLKDRLKELADKADIKEEIDKLERKLAKKQDLTRKEQEQIADQLQDLRDRLKRLSRREAKREQLQRDKEQGKINQETLDRELKKLDKQAAASKDLAELAREMDRLNEALKNLDQAKTDQQKKAACEQCKEAAAQLKKAAGQVKDQKLQGEQRTQLRERLRQLQAAREELAQNLNGNPSRRNGRAGGSSPAQGRRPDGKAGPTGKVDQKTKAQADPKGKRRVSLTTGQSFKKVSVTEILGEVKEAAQVAPEAIEQQRIPPDAADIAKGYFENLAGGKKKTKP
jgi:hypothetical protein